jgi:hypothetical protein
MHSLIASPATDHLQTKNCLNYYSEGASEGASSFFDRVRHSIRNQGHDPIDTYDTIREALQYGYQLYMSRSRGSKRDRHRV